ncbi:orotidine-5'-phosphate decarboxylase [Dermacoccaceae bacterium W4C1]
MPTEQTATGAGATVPFGQRLADAVDEHGPLCVGLDPHPHLLQDWGLADDPDGLAQFCRIAVSAFAGRVAMVKPQSAFFERHGSAGVAVLETVLADLAQVGTLTLMDAKRGDIGSTMTAYAQAFCDPASPLAADAVTVSPFLGLGSLEPAFDLARRAGKGVFVLAMTSNPDGASVQHARGEDGRTIAEQIITGVGELNAGAQRFGDVGMVVGATVGKDIAALGLAGALADSRAPLLAPGLGAQGADADDIARAFGPSLPLVLPTSSRGILAAGPQESALARAVADQQRELGRVFGA